MSSQSWCRPPKPRPRRLKAMGQTVVSPTRMMSLPSEICLVVLRALTVSLGALKIVAESATPREDTGKSDYCWAQDRIYHLVKED